MASRFSHGFDECPVRDSDSAEPLRGPYRVRGGCCLGNPGYPPEAETLGRAAELLRSSARRCAAEIVIPHSFTSLLLHCGSRAAPWLTRGRRRRRGGVRPFGVRATRERPARIRCSVPPVSRNPSV